MSSRRPPSRRFSSNYDPRDDIIAEQERRNFQLEQEFISATKQLREELHYFMEQASQLQRNMYARIVELEHQLQMKKDAIYFSGLPYKNKKRSTSQKAKKNKEI